MKAKLCALALTIQIVSQAATSYTAVKLPGFFTWIDINNSGDAVGKIAAVPGPPTAQVYSFATGTLFNIGGPPGTIVSAGVSINSSGAVAGRVEIPGLSGFVYRPGTGITTLAFPSGEAFVPVSINDSGVMVGGINGPLEQAYIYNGTSFTSLGVVPGSARSVANKINNLGQVAGESVFSSSRPFLYSGGTLTDLGTLGGVFGRALSINDAGKVVGDAQDSAGVARPFIYSGGTMTALSASAGVAYDINASGTAVGLLFNSAGSTDPYLFENGTQVNLNTVLVPGALGSATLLQGLAINDAGQILALGSDGYYILTPKSDFSILPTVTLAPQGNTGKLIVQVEAKCAAGDQLKLRVAVQQASGATGHGNLTASCTGSATIYPVVLSTQGSVLFTVGAATAAAEVEIRGDQGSREVKNLTRNVQIVTQ